ncbi:uncharacterized protein LOC124928955 [Impatiens glandulifera]|uniref:uncharacterized protein LOC124928955 n=1 Tax=Impatiens glandulifera TaxID=253017 RepID=UPI001FB1152D|nr:uncharacterized protein LOC124928955 [Impatiens glandulifera]
MSSILCKRWFISEDLPQRKRIRLSSSSSSSSPVHPCPSALVDQLRFLFPDTDIQDLVRILNECGNVLDSAVKSIHHELNASKHMIHKQNIMIEKIEALTRDNTILKRAVSIQHQNHTESEDDKKREVENLKQIISQYQEQMRTLEMNNYALKIHLQQAQQGRDSIPDRFHPHIF